MTAREREEYRALRATIRERSTARSWTFIVGLSVWAALALAVLVLATIPVATLVPLLVLAGTFEAVFALHVTVERIGRYIQVHYEEDDQDADAASRVEGGIHAGRTWERTAMAFGRPLAGTGADPLFAVLFGLATLFNFLTAASAGIARIELGVIGVAHALMLARIVAARRSTARQRQADLERFRQLKSTPTQSVR